MKPLLFLDVDGVVFPFNTNTCDREATFNRIIVQHIQPKTVHGFVLPGGEKTFPVEEKVGWNTHVELFLKEIEQVADIVWVTGWKHNVPLVENLLNLTPHRWLQWDTSAEKEQGKTDAIIRFLTTHPETLWVWVDDTAPGEVGETFTETMPGRGLVIQPDSETGLTEQIEKHIQLFLHSTP